jgi:hypothetical protein
VLLYYWIGLALQKRKAAGASGRARADGDGGDAWRARATRGGRWVGAVSSVDQGNKGTAGLLDACAIKGTRALVALVGGLI